MIDAIEKVAIGASEINLTVSPKLAIPEENLHNIIRKASNFDHLDVRMPEKKEFPITSFRDKREAVKKKKHGEMNAENVQLDKLPGNENDLDDLFGRLKHLDKTHSAVIPDLSALHLDNPHEEMHPLMDRIDLDLNLHNEVPHIPNLDTLHDHEPNSSV